VTIAATQSTATQSDDPVPAVVSSWMTAFFAIACGLVVANVYYSQSIAGPIGASLGFSPSATGLIVTSTQAGFGAGLLLLVPLGDLIENRRLVLMLVGLISVALLGAALSTNPLQFLICALVLGLGSVAVQVLVPFAAHMAPEKMRGRAVGNVMSGVMVGIMLARPASSFVTEIASWHVVFLVSGASMVALALTLSFGLPKRVPVVRVSYGALLTSIAYLAFKTAILQRRALYQASLFGAFSLFWTTVPLLLVGPRFGLSQGGVALFALAGGAGVIAAPIAGRLADKGWTRPATGFAILAVAAALLMTHFAADGSRQSVAVLIAAAVLLDFGMTANLTLGQRAIFVLAPEFRSRLNGLYMAAFFVGGAAGSALGGWAYAIGGWPVASWIGFALPVSALIFFVTEFRSRAG
jgi:predicted MFS family arabinose efflux permease